MNEVEQINLYDAGLTLTTIEHKPMTANVWVCEHLQATFLAGGLLKINMIRNEQRVTWEYYGAALVRWKGTLV